MAERSEQIKVKLRDAGYVFSSLGETPLGPMQGDHVWATFAASYRNLVQDRFMADGGTYRYRRFSEFTWDGRTADVVLRPHGHYEQSRAVNRLNGGVRREFAPMQRHIAEGGFVRALLAWGSGLLSGLTGVEAWKIQCFQNQTLARSGETGQPTPEGIHRDGVDFVLTLLVERHNVQGGVTGIYLEGQLDQPVLEVELANPGQLLLNDDTRTLHGVTEIRPVRGNLGYRNIFNALFTKAG